MRGEPPSDELVNGERSRAVGWIVFVFKLDDLPVLASGVESRLRVEVGGICKLGCHVYPYRSTTQLSGTCDCDRLRSQAIAVGATHAERGCDKIWVRVMGLTPHIAEYRSRLISIFRRCCYV